MNTPKDLTKKNKTIEPLKKHPKKMAVEAQVSAKVSSHPTINMKNDRPQAERPIWHPILPTPEVIAKLPQAVKELEQRLRDITQKHQSPVLSVSMVVEDMVLLDAIYRSGLKVRSFTLNTGKLAAQSLATLTRAQNTYSSLIEEIHPTQPDLIAYFSQFTDFDDIYRDPSARTACCAMRIVKPLQRALKGADAWITGRWRGQAVTRNTLSLSETDTAHGLTKYNPLFDWDEALIWAYAQSYGVPINDLHLCGFPSIGCEPCTRAVHQGEDYRAGRWWWERPETKESGLHG